MPKTKPINRMRCSLPAISINEQTARLLLSAFLMQADPTAEELADLKTAVSEAVTNAIVHGYPDSSGQIFISAALYEDRLFRVQIRDTGCGIEDIPLAMTPLYTTSPEEERAGLGFAVMEAFCDRIRVSSRTGKGTTVTLEKRLTSKQEPGKAR